MGKHTRQQEPPVIFAQVAIARVVSDRDTHRCVRQIALQKQRMLVSPASSRSRLGTAGFRENDEMTGLQRSVAT
jgi:hypothetical protein